MSKNGILVIVEGASQEPKLVNKVIRELGLQQRYEVYSYGTNVHDLYRRLFIDSDDVDDLDLLGVLRERESDDDRRDLLNRSYSDVLLIFDYDPHDNRFDPEMFLKMARHFNESTEQGKLFVNYPMLEACKHFKEIPDREYAERKVKLSDLRRYKEIVGSETICHDIEKHFTKGLLKSIIQMTVEKACFVCGKSFDASDIGTSYQELSQSVILERQNSEVETCRSIYVLGTCVMFGLDYSPKLVESLGNQ